MYHINFVTLITQNAVNWQHSNRLAKWITFCTLSSSIWNSNTSYGMSIKKNVIK